jgi:hypothetical protein
MVVEAVQNYVNMVNGLTKTTRDKAVATARALLAQAGLQDVATEAGERVNKLAEEILLASRANRALVENLVTAEVDKAAARWGFVRAEEVDTLREELAELRASLVRATVSPPAAPANRAARKRSPARAATARKASAQQPPLGGAPAEAVAEDPGPVIPSRSEPSGLDPGSAQQPPAKKTAARKRATQQGAAQPTSASKTAAKKSAVRKAPAKRATSLEPATPLDMTSPAPDSGDSE